MKKEMWQSNKYKSVEIMEKTSLRKNEKSGFSLIEVLVSLFLFSTAIVGVVGMMTLETKKAMLKRNESIAGQLSQEGIELVRNIRDNNFMNNPNTFSGIVSGNNRSIDYNDSGLAGSTYVLYLDNNGLYNRDGNGVQTVFQRKIMVTGNGAQRVIYSMVTWERDAAFMNSVLPGNVATSCIVGNKCFFTQVTFNDSWGKLE